MWHPTLLCNLLLVPVCPQWCSVWTSGVCACCHNTSNRNTVPYIYYFIWMFTKESISFLGKFLENTLAKMNISSNLVFNIYIKWIQHNNIHLSEVIEQFHSNIYTFLVGHSHNRLSSYGTSVVLICLSYPAILKVILLL